MNVFALTCPICAQKSQLGNGVSKISLVFLLSFFVVGSLLDEY